MGPHPAREADMPRAGAEIRRFRVSTEAPRQDGELTDVLNHREER